MRWNQQQSNRDCANQPLAESIRGELDQEQCERLASHLDDCETCQQRLTVLAAESQWWLDASRCLDPTADGLDFCAEGLESDYYADNDSHYPDPQQELLTNGLLEPSEKPGVIGTLGRYEVQRVIGTGGTGIVLKATDVELNRTVAIKVLSPSLAASDAARRRFAREGQAVAAVAHKNVVAVHHVNGEGRLPFLVMQYIDGDSLQDLVVRDGPLDVTTVLRMAAQIASALAAAHDQGLVHRDVKPANILVGTAGQRVWITDFGLARAVDDASLTRTGFIAGTPHYMSPEQARGEAVRASSDLFGLGSVLYFMLTGRPPFRAERTLAILCRICNEPHRPVREVNPDVPPAIADLVDRLLNKSAADRIADAETVRTHCLHLLAASTEPDGDLNKIELGDSLFASVQPHETPPSNRRVSQYGAWAVVALLLIGLNVAGGVFFLGNRPPLVDSTELAQEEAAAADESPIADFHEPIALSDSVVAAEESVAFMARDNPPFAVIAAADEVESPPLANFAPQIPSEFQATAGSTHQEPPGAFDPPYTTPPSLADQTVPEPAWQDSPQSAPPGVVVATEEFSVWAITLNEIRASFELFETQTKQPSGGAAIGNNPASPSDSFDRELRRMEDTLRTLDSEPDHNDRRLSKEPPTDLESYDPQPQWRRNKS